MSSSPTEPHVEAPGPVEMRDPRLRQEFNRAVVWVSVVLAVVLIYVLAQPLFLIVGGCVFAAMLDGGARLLGRVLPIARGWRITIVAILAIIFLVGIFWYAGVQLVGQFQALKQVVTLQLHKVESWAGSIGLMPTGGGVKSISGKLLGSMGNITSVVGTAVGAVTSVAMIVVLGLFIAAEPRLYQRGIAWMLPMDMRDSFYETAASMARSLRRLMAGRLIGMAAEGVFVGFFLWVIGVPMALVLGILTGLLAFLPNIGAIMSGALTIIVGFSAGTTTGLLAIAVYVGVQTFDGYVVVPTVARRAVDLAPALVLAMQLLLGALFGLLGLIFADPIVAMAKAALEKRSGLEPMAGK